MAQTEEFIATGRRKTSVARIRMTAGSGKIDINGRSFEDYFPTAPLQNTVLQPLQAVKIAVLMFVLLTSLAYLVCSPRLLDTRATNVEDMRLVNTLLAASLLTAALLLSTPKLEVSWWESFSPQWRSAC